VKKDYKTEEDTRAQQRGCRGTDDDDDDDDDSIQFGGIEEVF
jgi:hypothetical protein